MNISQFTDKVKDLNLKAALPATAIFAAWLIAGLTLTGQTNWGFVNIYGTLSLGLLIFFAYYWKSLTSPAGLTWRNIISTGLFINLSAVGLVLLDAFSSSVVELSILYWLAVPGYGFMVNSKFLEQSSRRYALAAHGSSMAAVLFTIGYFRFWDSVVLLTLIGIGSAHGITAYTALNAKSE